MINENLQKGILTEMKCHTFCIEHGCGVSLPISPMRYDFILDYNGKLLRVQVKTSRLKTGGNSIVFNCRSVHSISGGNKSMSYSSDEIDYYMTLWEEKFYLIPITECGVSEKTLRITPVTSTQATNCVMAEQFLAEEVLKSI